MAPKIDIGWEFGQPITDNRKMIQCKFCGKIISGGITRLKQHLARISGNVESCSKAPNEISLLLRKHLQDSKLERNLVKKKKEAAINAIQQSMHADDSDSDSENYDRFEKYHTNEEALEDIENRALRKAIKESRKTRAFEEEMRHQHGQGNLGASSSLGATADLRKQMPRSFSVKEGAHLPKKGIDAYMFPSKRMSIKNWFAPEKVKDVGKAISKWFIYNAIPFNAADNGPYYQSMINTIAEAGPGINGPTGRQIGGLFLQEEVEDITGYLNTLKSKWPKYGCTIMCDGWSTRNKHPIINFMIYCDRTMIFHSSVDCTNKKKTTDFILSLLNKVIDEVGEENVVHVVTDSESANKAAGQKLMLERPNLFWSPCAAHCIDLMLEDIGKMKKVKACIEKAKQVTSFIYNSDKVVNLMKSYTNDRELLRPGITRFATVFISLESLVRYSQDLKRMCTSVEWQEYNNTSRRRKDAEKVATIILDAKFWKTSRDICAAMEPLVKVLKLVDQDTKPTLSIIYEAMDRAKMAIKENVKDWQQYWNVIDDRWYNQLHQHLHAAAYFLNPILQYSGTCVFTDEVRRGVKTVIKRLESDLNAQAAAISEIKLFIEQIGEFGSALAKTAVKKSLPAEWWSDYGEQAPHLRKIAIKVLSQTCSSSGCERNWSTWSLIHTKLRNRLAIEKLHKLVYVHYNMRLRVRNLMHENKDDNYYSPIDLNHIFKDDDILDEWTRDTDPPVLEDDDLEWLDHELPSSNTQAHITTVGAPSQSKKKNNKGKSSLLSDKDTLSSDSGKSEDSDDGDDDNEGNNRESGGKQHDQVAQDDQHDTGMTWAQGKENYYATQDTDHGYRPGIEEQRRYLASLSGFSSGADDEYLSGSQSNMSVEGQIKYLGLGINQQLQFPDDYRSRNNDRGFEHFGRTVDGYHGSGYGYSRSYSTRHNNSSSSASRNRSRELNYYDSSQDSGYMQNQFEGYSTHGQTRFNDYHSSTSSGIGRHGHDYRSPSASSSSSRHPGSEHYHRRDEALLNQHPVPHTDFASNVQFTQYPSGQFNTDLYPHYTGHQGDEEGEYNNDFILPRHSSWY